MRNFLCGGLKDTDQYLEKGIIAGIMRIARESVFSGLNNIGVYTLLSKEFNDKLGFIVEFKKVRKKETLETALKSALEQVENKKYETELIERGINNYKKLAIVFNGKEVTIKEG
jgi:hypothetical protein